MCTYIYNQSFNKFVTSNISESNVSVYIIFILIFCVIFLILINVTNLNCVEKILKMPAICAIIFSGFISAFIAWLLIMCYLGEVKLFAGPSIEDIRYHQNETISVIALLGMLFASFSIVENSKNLNSKTNKIYIYLYAIAIGLIYAHSFYTPNVYSGYYNTYHFNAYFNSIYSSYMDMPRTSLNTSVYGYYGFILAPIMKLIGGGINGFIIMIQVLAFIVYICIAYVIIEMVENNVIKVLSISSLVVINCSLHTTIYLQLIPHRVLFGGIILAYLMLGNKKKVLYNPFYICGGLLLMILSIIWNFETGMVYSLSAIVFYIMFALKKYTLKQKKLYFTVTILLVIFFAVFLAALGITGLINVSMGGSMITFKEFIFPLMNKEYFGYLKSDYQKGIVAWYFVIAFALMFIGNAIYNTWLNKRGSDSGWKDVYMCSVGIMTAGTMTYYINRTAYGNMDIVYFTSILMIAVFSDTCIKYMNLSNKYLSRMLYKSLGAISLSIIMAYTVAGIYNFSYMEDFKKTRGLTENDKIVEELKIFSEECPKNTKAMGYSVPMVYYDLGWDTGYYLIDFADLAVYPDSLKYIQTELDNMNSPFIIEPDALDNLSNNGVNLERFYSNMNLEKSYKVGQSELQYWIPVNEDY